MLAFGVNSAKNGLVGGFAKLTYIRCGSRSGGLLVAMILFVFAEGRWWTTEMLLLVPMQALLFVGAFVDLAGDKKISVQVINGFN